MPLAAQMVQVGHACLEAGKQFSQPARPCHLVLCAVHSEAQLLEIVAQVEYAGAACITFYEPDNNLGFTAACTAPIVEANRRLFRRYSLWRGPVNHEDEKERGPPRFYLT